MQDPGAFLDALVDHLGYLSAGETEDIQIVDPTKKRTYGVVHIEATEEDLVESLYQGVAKVSLGNAFAADFCFESGLSVW